MNIRELEKEINAQLIVLNTCICQRFMHEYTKYPRDGYREKDKQAYTLHKGDEVKLLSVWQNWFGVYARVEHKGKTYDLLPAVLTRKL